MKRELIKTGDASYTLSVPELNETYHSIHGAQTESTHIFIKAGLDICESKNIRILEFGMGTGLNVYLTYLHSKKKKLKIYYHTIEKYPISSVEIELINQDDFFKEEKSFYDVLHECDWNSPTRLTSEFTIFKENSDFRTANPSGQYDLIYFDAFSPDVQPELWSLEVFKKIYKLTANNGIITTYSSKGQVRRNLVEAGFQVEKLPGPPGKREFLRGKKVFVRQ